DKAKVEEGVWLTGDSLVDLSHRHIEEGQDKQHNAKQADRRSVQHRLLISLMEGVQPAEMPGEQDQQAAPGGQEIGAEQGLKADPEIQPERVPRHAEDTQP